MALPKTSLRPGRPADHRGLLGHRTSRRECRCRALPHLATGAVRSWRDDLPCARRPHARRRCAIICIVRLLLSPRTTRKELPVTPLIEAVGLQKRFGKTQGLDALSFTAHGGVIAVL